MLLTRMSLRFNQVFVVLLSLAVVSAFFLPARLTDRLRGIQSLFAPVSRPARAAASSLHDRFAATHRDTREVADVKVENERLRTMVMSLSGQLEELKRVANDLDRLGDVRPLCTRFKVVGDEPGMRDSLLLAGSSRENLREEMPVLTGRGLVGMIERVGQAGAQVRLITDRDFKVSGEFVRITPAGEAKLASAVPLVRGVGNGMLQVDNILLKETALAEDPARAGIAVGDYVKLNDPLWPVNLKGMTLGQVESIQQQTGASQHAQIRVRPILDLTKLNEVMVMNKLDTMQAVPASEKEAAVAN